MNVGRRHRRWPDLRQPMETRMPLFTVAGLWVVHISSWACPLHSPSPMLGVNSTDPARMLPPFDMRLALAPPGAAATLPEGRLRLLPRLALGARTGTSSLLLGPSDWLRLVSPPPGCTTVASGCWLHWRWCCTAAHAISTLRQRRHSSSCAGSGGGGCVRPTAGDGERRPPAERCWAVSCLTCSAGGTTSGSARSPQPVAGVAPAVASMVAASRCTASSIACT